jgi:hypothetical protein
MPGEDLSRLYLKQRKLGTLLIPSDNRFFLTTSHSFNNVCCIHIRIAPRDAARLEGLLLRVPRVQILELEVTSSERKQNLFDLYASSEEVPSSRDILHVLLSSVVAKRQTRLPLRVLNLKGLHFENCGGLITSTIDCENLQILVLQGC